MDDRIRYICKKCGKTRTLAPEETVPVCCEGAMVVDLDLPVCRTATAAEHSRFDDEDGPCDDGRAG